MEEGVGSTLSQLPSKDRTIYSQPPIDPPKLVEDGVLRELFGKELSRSDVSVKPSLLVIPKKHAEEYFPRLTTNDNNGVLLLQFLDRHKNLWEFRYRKNGQKYVFTKGWSNFVKANNLKEKDVIVFYECKEGCLIDVIHRVEGGSGISKEEEEEEEEEVVVEGGVTIVVEGS